MKKIFSNEAFEVMHLRNFRLFMTYRLLMTSATLMQSVVVGWLLYNITKSVLSLGMIGLTEVIPQVSIALFAGHFVDIWDRKRIIFYTTFLMLLSSAILDGVVGRETSAPRYFHAIPFTVIDQSKGNVSNGYGLPNK